MASSHSAESQTAMASLNERLKLLLPPLLCSQRSSWEQGIVAQALVEYHLLFEAERVPALDPLGSAPHGLVSWLYALAHDTLVRQAPDGRLAVLLNGDGTSDGGALDPACIGPTLYYLCSVERGYRVREVDVIWSSTSFPAPRGLATSSVLGGVERMLRYILEECPRASVPISPGVGRDEQLLSHRIDAVEIWSDSVYMLPPFLVSAAAFYFREPSRSVTLELTSAEGDPESRTYAAHALLCMGLQQIVLAAWVLQAPTGEWTHIFDLRAREFKRRAFWGVGSGWVCCGIVRVLLTALEIDAVRVDTGSADGDSEREEIVALLHRVHDILLKTVRACLAHMLPSHLFHDVLDDPASFEETNLAQMLSYTLYRLLDLHQHSPAFQAMGFARPAEGEMVRWEELAEAMRRAAEAKTDRWGFVRDVCGSPRFDAPGTATEGQAWAIMAEVARAQYLSHQQIPCKSKP